MRSASGSRTVASPADGHAQGGLGGLSGAIAGIGSKIGNAPDELGNIIRNEEEGGDGEATQDGEDGSSENDETALERPTSELEKLKEKWLERQGFDPEQMMKEVQADSRADIYRDADGNLFVGNKAGDGMAEYIWENIFYGPSY